jgi:hypothetical protein
MEADKDLVDDLAEEGDVAEAGAEEGAEAEANEVGGKRQEPELCLLKLSGTNEALDLTDAFGTERVW